MRYLLKIVVKVRSTCAEEPSQECGMGGKDRRNVDVPEPEKNEPNPCKPLVDMGHNVWGKTGIVIRSMAELGNEHGG